jgi:hypothetical protein
MQNLIEAALRARARRPDQAHFALVLRSDGAEPSERRRREFREKSIAQGIPVYDEMANAADALAGVAFFETYRKARS